MLQLLAWRRAVSSGVVFGALNVISPDHLGILLTVTLGLTTWQSFRVGMTWGFGHVFGQLVILGCFAEIQRVIHVTKDTWSKCGDYLVGLTMIVCGIYFIMKETEFLVEQEDGTFVAGACACHGSLGVCESTKERPADVPDAPPMDLENMPVRRGGRRSQAPTPMMKNAYTLAAQRLNASTPLVKKDQQPLMGWQQALHRRDLRAMLLGLLQGAACPMGLMGIPFLMSSDSRSLAWIFITVGSIVAVLGNALLSVSWTLLFKYSSKTMASPRVLYRLSCGLTLSLGIFWIIANYFDCLDVFEIEVVQNEDVLQLLSWNGKTIVW